RCVEDFLECAAEHARALAERLDHQEASGEPFLEVSEKTARRVYFIAIAAPVVAFRALSALLARGLSRHSAEQSAITALVKDEARGDTGEVIGDITGCQASSACRDRAGQLAASLKRPGAVSVIQLQPSTSFSIAGTEGTARVAWNAGGSLPI